MLGCISVPSADMHISLDFAANCWPFPRNCALSDLPQTPLELIERLKADMERGDPKKAVCAVWRQVSPGNYTIVNYIAAEKSLHRVRTDASEMLDEMPAEDLLVILERMAQSEQSSDVSRLLPAPQARFELRPSAATIARTARAEREEVEKEEVKETQKAAQNAPQASAAVKAAPPPAKTTTTVATAAPVAHKHHAANGYAIPDRFIHPERAAAQARAQRLAQEEKLRAEQAMKQETPAATATPAVASSPAASAPVPSATPEKRPSNTVQGDLFAHEAGCVLKQSPEANRADSTPAAASSEDSPASSDLFELTAAAEQTQTTPKAKGRTSKSAGAKTTRTKKSASATATKKPRTRKKASADAASGDAPTSAEEKTASRPKRSRRKKGPLSPIEAQKSAAEFTLESEAWPQA